MSETESSQWTPPAEKPQPTPQALLEEHFADREDPDDIDDMVMLSGDHVAPIDPFGVDTEITIDRRANPETGAPAYTEGGWKIIRTGFQKEVSGALVDYVTVSKTLEDGRPATKDIPLSRVYELNPITPEDGEKEPLGLEETKLADEAIEEAIGLENPEDVVARAREAAIRLEDEKPPLTQARLREMMDHDAVTNLKVPIKGSVHPVLPPTAFPGRASKQTDASSADVPVMPHDKIEDARALKITTVEAQPKNPPPKKKWWQ